MNELYVGYARKFPGRLLSSLGVDARRKGALELLRTGIEERGMTGLRFHPTTGFCPHDPVCCPFCEAAWEMGVAALIRLGTEPAPRKPMFPQPRFIDAVAAGFPELKTIIAPCGHGWWVECPDMAASRPNLYVDFSG